MSLKEVVLQTIEKRLVKIERILMRNTLSLEEHIRRTNLIEEELRPLKKSHNVIDGIWKLILSLVGVLVGLKQLGFFS
jgi:hypothetical protein